MGDFLFAFYWPWRAATTDFVKSDVSGGRWTPTRRLQSSTALWIHGLTTTTLFLPLHQGRYCTMNFTCSTSPTGCSSNWQWQFIGVWTAAHHRTCQTTASRVPPTANYLQYLATGSTLNGRRAFSFAGPVVWNSLPDFIRDPTISADCFRRLLKTYLFARY